jgi:hypothetical protein
MNRAAFELIGKDIGRNREIDDVGDRDQNVTTLFQKRSGNVIRITISVEM